VIATHFAVVQHSAGVCGLTAGNYSPAAIVDYCQSVVSVETSVMPMLTHPARRRQQQRTAPKKLRYLPPMCADVVFVVTGAGGPMFQTIF